MNLKIQTNYLELLKKINFIKILGETNHPIIKNISAINNANQSSLTWLNPNRKDSLNLLSSTNAGFIILKNDLNINPKQNQIFIQVDNPKYIFTVIVNQLIKLSNNYSIHETAIISPFAKINKNVKIGPYTVIGDCKIDEGTIISSHCNISDKTIIGRNVFIGSGSMIGNTGYGFAIDELGNRVRFPHLGGVIIEDDVEIGSNVCIDRGSLSDTIIRKGVKIDNLVHIAHNVEIGKKSNIVALAMIGGSTKIGSDVWVAPSSALKDVINIGDSSVVGLGAVVTKNIPSGEVWVGNPAKKLR